MSGVCMGVSARKRFELDIARLHQDTESALRIEADARERLTRLAHGAKRLVSSLGSDSVNEEVLVLACDAMLQLLRSLGLSAAMIVSTPSTATPWSRPRSSTSCSTPHASPAAR